MKKIKKNFKSYGYIIKAFQIQVLILNKTNKKTPTNFNNCTHHKC